jgi:hypothetical protein
MRHFTKWKEGGKPEAEGRPKLNQPAAVTIVRVLHPKICPGENEKEYTGMAKSIDRLMKI